MRSTPDSAAIQNRGVARVHAPRSGRIFALVVGLVISGVFAALPSSAFSATENPKASLGMTPDNLSESWLKRHEAIVFRGLYKKIRVKINGKPSVPPVYVSGICYTDAYRRLMRMRKPALQGPNYGYWGDKGGKTAIHRGADFMSNLAQAANGAYHFGFTTVKKKVKRKQLKHKMRKRALYWAKRGLKMWEEGRSTDFTYIPDIFGSTLLVNTVDVIKHPRILSPSVAYIYPQPKRCKR